MTDGYVCAIAIPRMMPHFIPSNHTPISMRDVVVFEQVFRTYHKALCYYVERIIAEPVGAEDIVAELFLQCWNNDQRFENEDHARYFLYRAARNAAYNHLKLAQRTADKHEQAGKQSSADSEESHQEHYIRSEVLRDIYAQIDRLPSQERKVLLLTLQEGKKLQEIADELNLSLQTVKNCKTRAVNRLRVRLSADDFLLFIVLLGFYRPL